MHPMTAPVVDRPAHLDGRDNPVLLKLVAAIRAAYGPRVERIVLFGSRARGEEQEDSDYDVAVFMHGLHSIGDRAEEAGHLWDVERAVAKSNDPIFELIPLPAGSWNDRTSFMRAIRDEGVEL
jgi:uncharacterized protein